MIEGFEFTGFNRMMGFRLSEWTAHHAVLELDLRPDLLNRAGILHGGVVATMVDAVGGFAGSYSGTAEPRRVVTLSLTTSYLGQATSGTVRATARRRPGGRRIFVSTVEVADQTGAVIAVGQGTYRLSE